MQPSDRLLYLKQPFSCALSNAGRSSGEQREGERCTFARTTLDTDLSALSLGELLHKRQTEAGPAWLVSDLTEAAEDLGLLVLGNSLSTVLNADVNSPRVFAGFNRNFAATGRMTNCI